MHFSVDSSLARRIREQGRCKRSGQVTVRYLPGQTYRFSPVMAKKQGNAPERNRVKRIVRELMRAGEGMFPNGAYLIFCSGPCETLHHEELKSAILAIMDSLCAGARGESQEDEACI